jgi:hypothetical protein
MNSHDEVRAFITEPVLQQRLAKYMVCSAFAANATEKSRPVRLVGKR